MTIAQKYLEELERESAATRSILQAVPLDKSDWKPHPKSMSLGRLATHVAEIPSWFKNTLEDDELDFQKSDYKPYVARDTADLLGILEKNLAAAKGILEKFPDERMTDNWTMRNGDTIYFILPKEQVARTWCLNHWYHHRAQLGVFLRLLDIPLPGTYGPPGG